MYDNEEELLFACYSEFRLKIRSKFVYPTNLDGMRGHLSELYETKFFFDRIESWKNSKEI